MSNTELQSKIEYLFNRYWDEELSEEAEDALDELATSVISEFGWPNVYHALTDYLYQNCHTPEEAINAACNFWNCRWAEQIIPNPYVFLSFFYYKINLDEATYDQPGILDSLAITILPNAGISKADIMVNPSYSPLLDKELLLHVDEWKTEKNLFNAIR